MGFCVQSRFLGLVVVSLGILLALGGGAPFALAEGGDGSGAGDGSGVSVTSERAGLMVVNAETLGDEGVVTLLRDDGEPAEVSTKPGDDGYVWKFNLVFDQNVAYTDSKLNDQRAFIAENEAKVHLRRAESTGDVPFSRVVTGGTREERKIIYVYIDDWLDPFAKYELVADAGIVSANGSDTLTEPYTVRFWTNGMTRYGFTVQEFCTVVVVMVVFVAGIVMGVVRMRKRTR